MLNKFSMKETPDYSCWYKFSDSVYEPSEDTFVFLDGIEKELIRNVIIFTNDQAYGL